MTPECSSRIPTALKQILIPSSVSMVGYISGDRETITRQKSHNQTSHSRASLSIRICPVFYLQPANTYTDAFAEQISHHHHVGLIWLFQPRR